MTDREIAVLAFFFAFLVNWPLTVSNAKEFGLSHRQAIVGAAIFSFCGVAVAYVLTKWIVG